jgi:hypothetical protein
MSGQGAAIGAATGATYALATGKDPVKYAMIGGAVGGTGGAMIPGLPAGTAAGTTAAGTAGGTTIAGTGSALTGAGASTATNTAFMAPAGVNAVAAPASVGFVPSTTAGYTSAAVPNTIFSSPSVVNASQPLSSVAGQTAALERPLTYGMQGVEYGQGGTPTMMERFGQVGQFAQQNPALTQMAAQSAQGLLQKPQPRAQPAGLLRGNQIQVQAPQYQVGIPQVTLI